MTNYYIKPGPWNEVFEGVLNPNVNKPSTGGTGYVGTALPSLNNYSAVPTIELRRLDGSSQTLYLGPNGYSDEAPYFGPDRAERMATGELPRPVQPVFIPPDPIRNSLESPFLGIPSQSTFAGQKFRLSPDLLKNLLFKKEVSDMTNFDWSNLAGKMEQELELSGCVHTEHKKGLIGKEWGCKRKVLHDDLCEQPSSNKADCLDYIVHWFDIDEEKAQFAFDIMADQDLLNQYKCGAVFFR